MTFPLNLLPLFFSLQNKKLSTGGSKARKAPMMADATTQIGKSPPTRITSACQTEGVVCYMPPRLQTVQELHCLYRHPESELQLYIRQKMDTPPPITSHLDDPQSPISLPNEQWLSEPTCDSCARCIPVSQRVRFLRVMQEIAAEKEGPGCARCIPVRRGARAAKKTEPEPVISASTPKVCFPLQSGCPTTEGTQQCSTDKEAQKGEEGDGKGEGDDGGKGGGRVCEKGEGYIPISLQAPIDNLIQLCFKLENLEVPAILRQHMKYLLGGLHHLLAHLPVPLEPKKDCSSPSTPGHVAWNTGVKLQELKEALKVLNSEGENILPPYFLAELTQLQQVVHDTLLFATSGIQNETFAYDCSGCIMNSDLRPPPWRNQDLQGNPFFRRLCLDVGVRGIVQEIRKLQDVEMNVEDHSYLSDSDMESLTTDYPPTPPQSRWAKKTSENSNQKGKLVGRRRKKQKASKVRAKKLCPNWRKTKTDIHLTIPAPLTLQPTNKETMRRRRKTLQFNNSTSFSTVNPRETSLSPPNSPSLLFHQNDKVGSSTKHAPPLKGVAHSDSPSPPHLGHRVTDSNCTLSYAPTFKNRMPSPIQLVIADDKFMPPLKPSHTKTSALSPSSATTTVTSFCCPLSSTSSSPSSSTSISSSASSSVSSIANCTTHTCNSSASTSNSTAIFSTADYTTTSTVSTASCPMSPSDSSTAYSNASSVLVSQLHSAVSSGTTPFLQVLPATVSSTSVRAHLPQAAPFNASSSTKVNQSSMEQVNIKHLQKQANRKGFVSISSNPDPQPPNALKEQGYSCGEMRTTEQQQARPKMTPVPFSSVAPLVMHHPPGKQTNQVIPFIHPIVPLQPVNSGPLSPTTLIFAPFSYSPTVSSKPPRSLPPVGATPVPLSVAPSFVSLLTGPTPDITSNSTTNLSSASFTTSTSTSTSNSSSSSSIHSSSSSSSSSTSTSNSSSSTSLPSSSSSSAFFPTNPVLNSLFSCPSLSRPPLTSVKANTARPITHLVTGKRISSALLPTSIAAASIKSTKPTNDHIKSTELTGSTKSTASFSPAKDNASTSCSKNMNSSNSFSTLVIPVAQQQRDRMIPRSGQFPISLRVAGQTLMQAIYSVAGVNPSIPLRTRVNQAIPYMSKLKTIPYMSRVNQAFPSINGGSQAIPYVTDHIIPSMAEGSQAIPSMARGTQVIPSVGGGNQAIQSTAKGSSHAVNKQSTVRNVNEQSITSSMQPVALTKNCKKTQDSAMISPMPLLLPFSYLTPILSCSTPSTHPSPLSSHPTPSSTSTILPSSTHLPPSSTHATPPSLQASGTGGRKPKGFNSHSTATTIRGVRDCDIGNTGEVVGELLSDLSNGVAEVSSRISPVTSVVSMSSHVLNNCGLINPNLITREENTASLAADSCKKEAVTGMYDNSESLTISNTFALPNSCSALSCAPVIRFPTVTLNKPTPSKSTCTKASSLSVSVCHHTSSSTHSTSGSFAVPIASPVTPTENHVQHRQSSLRSAPSQKHVLSSSQSPPLSTTSPTLTPSLPSSVSPDEPHLTPLQSTLPVARLSVTQVANGLLIKWTFANEHLSMQTQVDRYELYAFVCSKGMSIPDISQWGKVGEIKPLALPMAVTLTNFATGQCYAFSVKVYYNGGLSSNFCPPSTVEL